MNLSLSASEAWDPLPTGAWDDAAARHLLRRATWTAGPAEVGRALSEGLPATLARLFPPAPIAWPKPPLVAELENDMPAFRQQVAQASDAVKHLLRREEVERSQAAVRDMGVRWMELAAIPENSAFAKWVLFLSGVYVVATEKVKNAAFVYRHFEILAQGALASAPSLAKAVSRSPAMEVYLDLVENRAHAPNENFARELFELFLLGEGNYTEDDIKDAARAFTGYRLQPGTGRFVFAPRQHDDGEKTVFGHTGRFTGDDIIELAYGQRAAGAHLPKRMAAFYLSDIPLPADFLLGIGDRWRGEGNLELRWLVRTFFGSRLFFAPEFRGNFIKSPVQLYLGLVQDLGLKVVPVPRLVLNPLRQMGQTPFDPPNVRGWVGGRAWINSASLAARREVVERLFAPFDADTLTADEVREVDLVRVGEAASFSVPDGFLEPWARLEPEAVVARLSEEFLAIPPEPAFLDGLRQFLKTGAGNPAEHKRRLRRAMMTVFESPEYQVC
jgi:uncharacterized protein (DUF1800 family)